MPAPPEPAAAGAPDNRSLFFASRILPWLLGGLMLGVYGLTLNHWISADSLGLVSRLEGLAWTPSYNAPVTFLITYPFGWLPVGWIPVAVNLFTAVCAALSLVWLARSVTLLPHDLSKVPPPWRRSFQPPGLMTTRGPWLPPLFAVLVCGLQLNFWQNAVTATGQMFNLLLFAYVLRCFLEYNASGRDAWLLRSAPVYGLAVANDWGMILLLPLYVVALVWVKGVFSFDRVQLEKWLGGRNPEKLRLWRGLSVGWLAGVCLFLLLPVLAWLDHAELWPSLQHAWMAFKTPLAHVSRPFLLSAGLISVLPVFLIGLRYYHLLAGLNQKCVYPGLAFLESVYGFFLLLSLWTMFDPPLSPR
jgi:hypothetical protein